MSTRCVANYPFDAASRILRRGWRPSLYWIGPLVALQMFLAGLLVSTVDLGADGGLAALPLTWAAVELLRPRRKPAAARNGRRPPPMERYLHAWMSLRNGR